MKVFGEGKLSKPEDRDASLKFVFTNDLVNAITIGMLKTTEVERHAEADEPDNQGLRIFRKILPRAYVKNKIPLYLGRPTAY